MSSIKELIYASSVGDTIKAKDILLKGVDINSRNASLMTPLMVAVMNKQLKMVEFLISNGADLNLQDDMGYSALSLACQNAPDSDKLALDIVDRLLAANADVYVRNFMGATAHEVVKAYGGGRKFVINRLESVMKNTPVQGLISAIEGGKTADVGFLLGDVIDTGRDLNSVNVDGVTALMVACAKNAASTVSFLIDSGVDVNVESPHDGKYGVGGSTALMIACSSHASIDIIKQLLANDRANVNAKNSNGQTAQDIAEANGYFMAADLLAKTSGRPRILPPINNNSDNSNPGGSTPVPPRRFNSATSYGGPPPGRVRVHGSTTLYGGPLSSSPTSQRWGGRKNRSIKKRKTNRKRKTRSV